MNSEFVWTFTSGNGFSAARTAFVVASSFAPSAYRTSSTWGLWSVVSSEYVPRDTMNPLKRTGSLY